MIDEDVGWAAAHPMFLYAMWCISKFFYICTDMRVVNIFLITIVGLCLTVLASTSCVSQDDNVECVDVEHIAEPEITSDTITLLFGWRFDATYTAGKGCTPRFGF